MKTLLVILLLAMPFSYIYAAGLDPYDSAFPVIEFDHECMSYDIGAWQDAVGANPEPTLMLVQERPDGKRVMVGSLF